MRKIVAFLFVSVDGVVGEPADWLAMSEDVAAMVAARTASADTILLGRATYEKFAAEWPHRSGPIADFVNTTRKVVVSTSLDEVSWANTALIDGNALIGEELQRLRCAAGKDIVVLGSATLVQSLLRRTMIDDLVLLVHPVIKGRGRRLFDGLKEHAQMQNVQCATFDSGLASLSYEMPSRPATGHEHERSRGHMRPSEDTTLRRKKLAAYVGQAPVLATRGSGFVMASRTRRLWLTGWESIGERATVSSDDEDCRR